MREIRANQIKNKVKALFLKANFLYKSRPHTTTEKSLRRGEFSYREICLKDDYRK